MIRSIGLSNFKCFEQQQIPCRSLTLLSGLNGAGKSSVMQALLLLRQSHQQALLPGTGLALNGDLVRIGTAMDALFEGAREDSIGFNLDFGDGIAATWSFHYLPESDVLDAELEPSDEQPIYNQVLFGDHFQYLQAERLGPRTSFEFSEFHTRQHRQLGSKGEYTAYYLHTFGDEPLHCPDLRYDVDAPPTLRGQAEAWLAPICPGIRLNLAANSSMDLMSLEYSLALSRGVSNRYRSTNMGFGITYILPVLVAVLSAIPGDLILLENPEAHLHPRGQALIGQLLARAASCGVQIIVETHSDHVLNGIRLAVHDKRLNPSSVQLHFFSRDSDLSCSVISPRIDRHGRIDPWPENFFDEWDRSLEGLLEPTRE